MVNKTTFTASNQASTTLRKGGGWWSQPKIDPARSSAPHTHTLSGVQLCLVLLWAEMTTEQERGWRERERETDSELNAHSVLTSHCDTNVCSLRYCVLLQSVKRKPISQDAVVQVGWQLEVTPTKTGRRWVYVSELKWKAETVTV
ncbi:hypothetical protein NQZ68_026505 [Dissostichus eleginoides]|nr:hypothetical protein NQZ68_026505 [Dissostichus eleginoides]